ncbi:MAG: 5-formyltetrahydrofolate cyclo-ligase [Acutalibacteraceae bacterium]
MTKAELRSRFLSERRSMTDKAERDAKITEYVLQNKAFRDAQTVFLYVSMPLEVDTFPILRAAWAMGKTVAVPRCGEDRTMTFHRVDSEAALAVGAYGILEPQAHCPAVWPQKQDLCIVPALTVDKCGTRLGFGGGYYDRFLQKTPMFTMALCYTLSDALPREPWDIPMHSVVTASGYAAFDTISQGGLHYG